MARHFPQVPWGIPPIPRPSKILRGPEKTMCRQWVNPILGHALYLALLKSPQNRLFPQLYRRCDFAIFQENGGHLSIELPLKF